MLRVRRMLDTIDKLYIMNAFFNCLDPVPESKLHLCSFFLFIEGCQCPPVLVNTYTAPELLALLSAEAVEPFVMVV